ncbi:4-(cytidine 5'-diphospho)-2-C-methyl-D-erythritol kinase [Candidatus Anaplasma sp. TIGMIC]|uniref:4-(cytidine 5'-diphospho)-2-C-methyl-D-erythritol kinase n=1 Tax=Candidatus Anaplasma sp. TIGMIC TaxID=3020713 RepID=UPI00232B7933|nr:4-(cytidine 5'-diphospho)-2-C-methyl-D-erythritol kinase [Candidatus Anaplasma sp. TIGMIC]MDB1135373.1 4-(cytidine 5'-diphospho)-2-C-methyl-D-erythritol kinase [Candidatus Anaplasma sp. TIGMIC]
MSRYLINAPAKINLFLHVVGKASCGYHLIESVFAFIELYDVMEIEIGSKRRGIRFLGSSGISRRDNTIQRSIGHLVRRCSPGTADNVYVKVLKNIPVSAGLAGGSVDAAAAIKLLSKLWGINDGEARRVAFRVGSDVPVCLESRTAFVSGMGDNIKLIDDSFLPANVVLVGPRSELSTKSVFQLYNPQKFSVSIGDVSEGIDWLTLVKGARNDLTDAASTLVPEIQKVLEVLQMSAGCCIARMSGSGAMCFALFHEKYAAETAAQHIKEVHPDWFVYRTNIIKSTTSSV